MAARFCRRLPHRLLMSLLPAMLVLLGLTAISTVPTSASTSGANAAAVTPTVYVVIAVDTENSDWSWFPDQPLAHDPNPLFDTTNYKRNSFMSKIFDPAIRSKYKDSFGRSFRMSWFAQMDQQFGAATYKDEGPEFSSLTGTPAGYTAVMDTLKRYWGSQIQQFGDGIFWHHHVEKWNGYSWVGMENAISGYTGNYDSLNHMIVDRSYFPSTFRAGWCWEDSNVNKFLEPWVPFDLSDLNGAWKPYHPNVNDAFSTTAPNLARWMTRSDSLTNSASVNAAFSLAQKEGKAIYSFFIHDRDDMSWFVNNVQSLLVSAQKKVKNSKFKYVTAQEAMQEYLGFSDRTAPQLSLASAGGSSYRVTSNEAIWKGSPYLAAQYAAGADQYYERIDASAAGTNQWTANVASQKTISPPAPEPPEYYPVAGSASNSYGADYGPEKAYDGNPATYWDSSTATFPQWLKLDLVAAEPISKMTIQFYDTSAEFRTYSYNVEGSTDGTSWTTIVPGNTAEGLVTHQFSTPVTAKQIRINVTGSNVSSYAHICEVHLYGSGGPAATPITLPLVKVGVGASDPKGNAGATTLAAAVPATLTSASSLTVKATYDQTKAASDAAQVTLQVVNPGGANMSSSNLQVAAVDMSPGGLPKDTSKHNKASNFEYHGKVNRGGEYSFNIPTKGLKPGEYTLKVKIAGNDKLYDLKFRVK